MLSQENIKIWAEVDREFHITDALERLAEYLGYDVDDVTVKDIAADPRYIASGAGDVMGFCDVLAERFEDEHDCNIADNQIWENIISRELQLA